MEIDLENLPEQKSRLQNIIAFLASKNKELVQSNIVLSNQYKAVSEEHKTISQKYSVLSLEYEVFQIKYKEAIEENERLKEKLKLLREKSFGKSSEKLKREIDNLALQIEDNEISLGLTLDIDNIKEQDEKKKPKRQKLSENLPREDIVLEAGEVCPECGEKDLRKIGEDISEKAEFIPAQIKVIRYIRPRCACKKCDHIFQSAPVSNGIDKGMAGPGLLSHIMVQKYCDHLPSIDKQKYLLEQV